MSAPGPEEMADRQAKEQQAQMGLDRGQQGAMRRHSEIRSEMMRLIEEDEDIRGLSDHSQDLLKNLLSKAFPLGNYVEAEETELKWRIWLAYELFLSLHPKQGSVMQGPVRAFAHDDASARIRPLSQEEKLAVFQVVTMAWSRLTRGRDMRQQEIMATVRSESVVDRGDTDDSGGIIGRLGG